MESTSAHTDLIAGYDREPFGEETSDEPYTAFVRKHGSKKRVWERTFSDGLEAMRAAIEHVKELEDTADHQPQPKAP